MGGMEETGQVLAAKFAVIFPHLDERQRRLLMGAEARALGHGGIRLVARAAGVREGTVSLGVDELDSGAGPLGRVRRPGGGPSGRRPVLTLARLLAAVLHYRLGLSRVAIARPARRPPRDGQQATPRHPPAPRPGRHHHPARPAAPREPERTLRPGKIVRHRSFGSRSSQRVISRQALSLRLRTRRAAARTAVNHRIAPSLRLSIRNPCRFRHYNDGNDTDLFDLGTLMLIFRAAGRRDQLKLSGIVP